MVPRPETQTGSKRLYNPTMRILTRSDSETSDTQENEESTNVYSDHESEPLATEVANSRQDKGLPPTVSLPILVFIDMFAVSLVVPLLFQYYKNAGVTNANQRELLSSVFSSSQIVGGMALGAMADAQLLRRKSMLFLSFGGSALAYALIAFGGFHALILSRILVGLVKQTMTVTTSILTRCTTDDNRAKYMGRLQSSSTASWIIGPSMGGILFKYVDPRAPALLACALFLLNMVLAAFLLQDEIEEDTIASVSAESGNEAERTKSDFWTNLKKCFSSQALGSVIATTLIFHWVNRATSYSSMGSYYEDMYGLETHQRGYIQSYQQVLGFIAQSTMIGPILSGLGGERRTICWAALLLAIATFLEVQRSMPFFLVVLSPAISLSVTMMNVSMRSLLTRVAPEDSIFSVFAALDVLQNASAVSVPFYRTFLFRILGDCKGDTHSTTSGDPDPMSWVISSGVHWVLATLVMTFLLRPIRENYLGIAPNSKSTDNQSKKRQ